MYLERAFQLKINLCYVYSHFQFDRNSKQQFMYLLNRVGINWLKIKTRMLKKKRIFVEYPDKAFFLGA
jgi:hypothetical protein